MTKSREGCDIRCAYEDKHISEIELLRSNLKIAVDTIKFYADRNSWKFESYKNDCKDMIEFSDLGVKSYTQDADFACSSGGRRAREALAAISGEVKNEQL